MRRRNFLRLGSGEAIGGALVAACGADTAAMAEAPRPEPPSGIVRGWNALALRAIRETQPGPLRSGHALAILHTCMYNAWAAYDDDARQTTHGRAVRLPRSERSAASRNAAMSYAAHMALCDRFPSHKAGFDARMAGLALAPSRLDGQFTPAGIGRIQAAAMLDVCRRDRATLPFAPQQYRAGLPAAQPAATRGAGLDADAASAWCRLAQQVSERDGYGDDRDVLLYFVLANALADSAIAAAELGIDPVPGQAVADAAAAVVLRSFTGNDEFGAARRVESAPLAGQETGKEIGARVFEKARRYWQGKL
jgi:hypothetical protein